jgi:teichuronic acid biosynthesis glycosyltransferase TuaC
MRVLAVTKIFPNALEPGSAPFNRLQFSALGERCELEVLATIPWFPGASAFRRWSSTGRLTSLPERGEVDGLKVRHPRFAYLPRWGHGIAGHLYAASLAPTVLRYRGRIDVLLGSWAYPDGFAAVALAELLGVPAVVKVHGSDLNVLSEWSGPRRRIQWALPRAARVVAVSRPLAQKAIELGVDPARIDIVPNGIDRRTFHPRDRGEARRALGLAPEVPIALYVGHVTEQKGAFDLVRAFSAAGASLRGTRLVIVGDGAGLGACAALCKELGVDAILVGAESHDRVPLWLAACDVLALPSWNEGTPNVVLEALACGRRVVATAVGGIPDVVTSDVLGILVPPREPQALAAALTAAMATPYDPEAIARLSPTPSWDESASLLHSSLLSALEARASATFERVEGETQVA